MSTRCVAVELSTHRAHAADTSDLAVRRRCAPAPLSSGVSFRRLPTASIEHVSRTVDHWLEKTRGSYEHPSSRHTFEMGHELKALIEPLRAEEARKDARLRTLEEMLAQWNECV
jgi:hypothetical protein